MPLAPQINAIDVTLSGKIDSKGIAYYDPNSDGKFYDFLKDISEHETIIGFEWYGEKFGVILGR